MLAERISLPRLAAICYGPGEGVAVDATLARLARALGAAGLRLAGAVQRNTPAPDRCRCDMALEDLGSGRIIGISEDRGPGAQGCRLDPAALEEMVGLAGAALDAGADLLIVNKFGKREGEGRGFRQVIEAAAARGVPVLVAVSRENLAAWQAFAAGLDERLRAELDPLVSWCLRSARGGHQAPPAAVEACP